MKTPFKAMLLTISICLNFLFVSAQERAITIEAKRNTNQSIDFNYTKTDPGTYTVVVNFTSLSNTSHPGASFRATD